MNPLEGQPLSYLIGPENAPAVSGRVVEVPNDTGTLSHGGPMIAYCNLFDDGYSDQDAATRAFYGPYLHTSDTAQEYGEGQIDPKGAGFERNLIDQFTRCKAKGFEYIEIDNPDAYRLKDVLRAINIAYLHGLKVIAKNPGLGCDGDPADTIVSHSNVYGIIVEKGAGSATSMNAMRWKASRLTLPVWFVFFGSGYARGKAIANEIRAHKLPNMGVTYSSRGEYGNVIDLCVPNIF